MFKRHFWLLLSICAPLLFVWTSQATMQHASPSTSYEVIINEWSQGDRGDREWVELLVTTDADLRGFTLNDGEEIRDAKWYDRADACARGQELVRRERSVRRK